MTLKSCYFLILGIFFLTIETDARTIWLENFDVPDKGYWGDADGVTVHADLDGIAQWTLHAGNCVFTAPGDYVKTVTTSGGRLEAIDCDGEAVWKSEWIPIAGEYQVSCSLIAKETGSGATETNKYIHVYYQIDNGQEVLFETNGSCAGNWTEAVAEQTGLEGDSLLIIIRMNSTYASDKLIVDEIKVESQEPPVLPENLAQAGDVVINEILFNPYPDCPDFAELVNISDKELRLDHLFIASRDSEGNLKQVGAISADALYLLPGQYLLLSEKPDTLAQIYPHGCAENFLAAELPSMPDAGGFVVLLDDSMNVVDELVYSEKMHHPSIGDREGVSLERMSFSLPTNDAANWTSAAASVGFATPGCPNSMLREEPRTSELTIEPKTISPNGDGYNDILTLHLNLNEPNWLMNLWVFDASGHLVDQLQRNLSVGQTTDLEWNGRRLNGQVLAAGIYVLYMELTNNAGSQRVFKESITIVDKIM